MLLLSRQNKLRKQEKALKAQFCEWARLNGLQILRGKQDESVAVIS